MKKIALILTITVALFASDYQEWLQSQQGGYTDYKKSMDEEFSDMLKKDWEQFKAYSGEPLYEKPKPKKLPVVKKEKKQEIVQESKKITPKKVVIKKPEPKEIPKKEIPQIKKAESYAFSFFGEEVVFTKDSKLDFTLTTLKKEEFARFWDKASKSNFQEFLKETNYYKNKFYLNDWALFQLVFRASYAHFKDKNSANLHTWFILSKLGFDVKVAYNSTNLYLLGYVKHKVYQLPTIRLDGKRYYQLTFNGKKEKMESVYTYKSAYNAKVKPFDFNLYSPIMLKKAENSKSFTFKYKDKTSKITLPYNKALIDLYSTFPQADYKIYFDAHITPETASSMLQALNKEVKGKSEYEAVNTILRFVQKAFAYKTDPEQFGYEKVMFPEETLFYAYSDCEDRSIIFSYLIKNLLGLDIVGLKYKDHIATAVKFSTYIKGDAVTVGDERYVIADPTYENADAGMSMPQYKNSSFRVIK